MILKIFSVYDMKAKFFGQPFYEQQEESALRAFTDAVNDSSRAENMWNKHPADFQLFVIGEFDNESGHVHPLGPNAIVMASAVHRSFDSSQLELFQKNGEKKVLVN